MILEYPSSIIFDFDFQNILKKDEKIIVLKSKDLLKAEIYAYNLIKFLKYPTITIYYDFEDRELFLIKFFKILKDYGEEKGEFFYESIDQYRNVGEDLVIFLPYLPESLFPYLKNLSEFFLNLKFFVLSRGSCDFIYSLDLDEINSKKIDSFIESVYENFERIFNDNRDIKNILSLTLSLPLFNASIISHLTGLEESIVNGNINFINKNFFPLYKIRRTLKDNFYYLTFSKFIKEKFEKLISLDKEIYKRIGEIFENEKLIEEAILLFRKYENFEEMENLIKKNIEKVLFDYHLSYYTRYIVKEIEDEKLKTYPFLLALKGEFYLRKYDFEKSEKLIKNSIENSEEKEREYLKIFELLYNWETGKDDKIISEWESLNKGEISKAVRAYFLYRVGGSFLFMEETKRAEECLLEALSLAMDLGYSDFVGDIANTLGYVVKAYGYDLERAIVLFKKRAYTDIPNFKNIIGLFNLGYVYAFLGKFDEAGLCLKDIENLGKLFPENYDGTAYFYLKGIIHFFKREFDEAISSFEEILKISKRPLTIFNISLYMAKCYFFKGDADKGFYYLDKSLEYYKPSSKIEQNSVNLVNAIGFYKSGKKEKMFDSLEEIKQKEKFLSNEEKLIFYYLLEILGDKKYEGRFDKLREKLKAVNFLEGFK